MEVTAYLDIPNVLLKADFEKSPSELYFLKHLGSKLSREFKVLFDIDPARLNSGKIMVKLVSRKLSQLQMSFNSNMQKLVIFLE